MSMQERVWSRLPMLAAALLLLVAGTPRAQAQNPNDPGILEPVLSAMTGTEVRMPHTDQANGTLLLNVEGNPVMTSATENLSLLGYPITRVTSPNDDMSSALQAMDQAAGAGNGVAMRAAARDLMDILLGTTQGRIYDGFSMLNFNRGAYLPDQVPGEYKMKVLRDTGLTEMGIDGQPRKIWEVDVNMLWYDGNFDADTFLLRVPVGCHEFDTIRIHYRIYSLVREDFSPTVVTQDRRMPGSVQFPFKGFDSVWMTVGSGTVLDVTLNLPPSRLMRGVYTWGWRVHPPRIQFLQPVYEHVNAHTGLVELEPEGQSFAFRNRQVTLDSIGEAAPEKKMYEVAKAALDGADTATIEAWLTQGNAGPRGIWTEWADLAKNQLQLPPEAWDVLAQEGIPQGTFGPYRYVSVFVNEEMYGSGPNGNRIEGWQQGDRFPVKVINLDNHVHYYRNVDFGPRLHDDIVNCCGAGSHSFEVMNFKPFYGAPKVAEVQWRAGWGFRPHFDVIQQADVFHRTSDQGLLKTYFDGNGNPFLGWQYSAANRNGDFRFNPPPFIIGTPAAPSAFPLREGDGSNGILVGRHTEGYGVAEFCPQDPFPGFCSQDIAAFNPNGALNWPPPPLQGVNGLPDHPTELRFPPFLRNPSQGDATAGDIIPPTPAWKPFLFLSPQNGTLFIDPADPSQGFWADRTFAHGRPVAPGGAITANIEAARGSAQVFYQFDPLFHDNAIFSPHPTFSTP